MLELDLYFIVFPCQITWVELFDWQYTNKYLNIIVFYKQYVLSVYLELSLKDLSSYLPIANRFDNRNYVTIALKWNLLWLVDCVTISYHIEEKPPAIGWKWTT